MLFVSTRPISSCDSHMEAEDEGWQRVCVGPAVQSVVRVQRTIDGSGWELSVVMTTRRRVAQGDEAMAAERWQTESICSSCVNMVGTQGSVIDPERSAEFSFAYWVSVKYEGFSRQSGWKLMLLSAFETFIRLLKISMTKFSLWNIRLWLHVSMISPTLGMK